MVGSSPSARTSADSSAANSASPARNAESFASNSPIVGYSGWRRGEVHDDHAHVVGAFPCERAVDQRGASGGAVALAEPLADLRARELLVQTVAAHEQLVAVLDAVDDVVEIELPLGADRARDHVLRIDRKSTRLNSSHVKI